MSGTTKSLTKYEAKITLAFEASSDDAAQRVVQAALHDLTECGVDQVCEGEVSVEATWAEEGVTGEYIAQHPFGGDDLGSYTTAEEAAQAVVDFLNNLPVDVQEKWKAANEAYDKAQTA